MFKFHVKLLEDLHQKKVVVSEMFQLIVDKDLSFENSQGRSTTHGMFEKATFSGPIFLFAPFSLVPGPTSLLRAPYFCLASKHLPSQQKNHTPPSLRFLFPQRFPHSTGKTQPSKNPMAIWNLWISILKATNLEVYVVFEVLLHLKRMLPKLVTRCHMCKIVQT